VTMNSAVLIGYGSIGRHHARVLAGRYELLAIVDVSEATREQAKTDYPQARVIGSLDELAGLDWGWSESVAVIASWGTSHAADFARLVDYGVRHVVCEKPMADSMERAAGMVRLADEKKVLLGHHFSRRYNGLIPGLKALSSEYGIGDPVGVLVQGGAAGIITNGIHYIDFTIALFGAAPHQVVGNVAGERINPRSKDLMLYGGSAVWSFSGGRELTVSLNINSSLAPQITIYYRDAVLRMDQNSNVELRVRDAAELKRYPAVTRTGAPLPRFSGLVPDLLDLDAELGVLLDQVEGKTPSTYRSESALEVLGACIGALEAGRTGDSVPLPIDPSSELGGRLWPIS
jgi:predicted dehydrogenase